MRTVHSILAAMAIVVAALASAAAAQPAATLPAPPPQLNGLSAEQAQQLIAKVKAAQAALRRGEARYFELLSGAPASYAETLVAPRDAFLAADFDRPFAMERRPAENPSWKPYRITLLPKGMGNIVVEIEVVLDFNDAIARVEMLSRAPHPF